MKRQEVRPLQKNDIRTCEITDFGENGEGIGRASGIPVFVSGALIGDTVKIKITKVKKKMAYARVEEILSPSPDRVAPACPVAAQCGGCQIMSYAYPAQLKYKEQKIRSLLQRIGHFDAEEIDGVLHPVIGMEEPYRFRNKVQVPVGFASAKAGAQHAAGRAEGCTGDCAKTGARDIVTGYYATHSHRIVPHEDCLIGDPLNTEILRVIREHMMQYNIPPYDEETHSGLVRHVLIRKGFATGEVMVCLVLNRSAEEDEEFIPAQDRLTEALRLSVEPFAERQKQSAHAGDAAAGLRQNGYTECCGSQPPCLASVCVNFNPQRTNVILGKETRIIHGRPYIEDVLSGLRFRISAQSFYQTNPYITERLYGRIAELVHQAIRDLTLEGVHLPGKDSAPVIWDLYCGIGTISLTLARSLSTSRIYGIEIVPQAIADAKENAALNGINNVTFRCADAAEAKHLPQPDIIIVDPPRKGCDRALLDTILTASPAHIIYVSCDPATLARDLRILSEAGYRPQHIQPYDMFSHSVHCETVVLLSHKKPDATISVNIAFGEGEGQIPLDKIAERAELAKPKEHVTYKMIQDYVMTNYGLKIHTAQIAEVKRALGLDMQYEYEENDDKPRPNTPKEKKDAIKDALKHFELI